MNEPRLITFASLAATGMVRHAFTTRRGGTSHGPFASLNMGFGLGDDPANVRANRRLVGEALGLDPAAMVAGRQVHGVGAAVVGARERGRGALSPEGALPATDVLLTAARDVVLTSYYADCVPLFFLDPAAGAVALAHAGWRGTVRGAGAACVQAMEAAFGSEPQRLLAVVGPAAGPCCYEVDAPVEREFARAFPRWPDLLVPHGPDRWLADLKEANRRSLVGCGLLPERIEVSGLCTVCRPDLFYSYRAAGVTGRMASVIALI